MYKTNTKKIRKILYELHALTSQEIEQFMSNVALFPKEGIDAVLKYLKTAKEKQNKVLEKVAKYDGGFEKDLREHVQKSSEKVRKNYEEKESEQAEKILEKTK